ncbi:hypothetical protein BpHYR1_019605 [Brachionus plicatilis]|uniref:Uncharacterized protein n=1 Tax=Brachionus plicatilis TaxID=10195 RepID=A0A3M7P1Q1_BRAPC|nr:hypothetical protein BpHYR1_019605 [Brachionus plicatilis]
MVTQKIGIKFHRPRSDGIIGGIIQKLPTTDHFLQYVKKYHQKVKFIKFTTKWSVVEFFWIIPPILPSDSSPCFSIIEIPEFKSIIKVQQSMLHFAAEEFLFNLYMNFTIPILR